MKRLGQIHAWPPEVASPFARKRRGGEGYLDYRSCSPTSSCACAAKFVSSFEFMKFSRLALAVACAFLISCTAIAFGQAPTDSVRVTVSMHPDGSRTVYNFDNAQHTAVATTTDPDGKVRQTIRYQLDDAGRFSSGEVSGPDGRVRLKSRYKYDDGGRILEEAQSAADGTLLNKIVYSYDSAGKQTGYSVFDASGKLVSRTGGASARPSPSPKPREKTKR